MRMVIGYVSCTYGSCWRIGRAAVEGPFSTSATFAGPLVDESSSRSSSSSSIVRKTILFARHEDRPLLPTNEEEEQ
jgi:hypothetical protein